MQHWGKHRSKGGSTTQKFSATAPPQPQYRNSITGQEQFVIPQTFLPMQHPLKNIRSYQCH
jgi:hypothetical protein